MQAKEFATHITALLSSALPVTRLQKRQTFRLRARRGEGIECRSGDLWITQDGDPRDVIVGPQESFTLDRAGVVVVSALSDAVFVYRRVGGWAQDVRPVTRGKAAAGPAAVY